MSRLVFWATAAVEFAVVSITNWVIARGLDRGILLRELLVDMKQEVLINARIIVEIGKG